VPDDPVLNDPVSDGSVPDESAPDGSVAEGPVADAPASGAAVQYGAPYYAHNGQAGDRPALRWYARLVRRYGGPGPYLDFGCGTGHLLRRLSALGPAAGLEVSPWSAAQARAVAGRPVYERLDDLPTAGFAVVVAVHVVEHLDDDALAAALAAWRRTLRPGGRALVVTPDAAGRGAALSGPRWIGFADTTHVNLQPAARWRRLLEAGGFHVEREGSDGLWNVPYGRRPTPLDAVRAAPALFQYLAGRLLLPPGSGESAVFVARRPDR
jgi:SAM-dependent methyltransferase